MTCRIMYFVLTAGVLGWTGSLSSSSDLASQPIPYSFSKTDPAWTSLRSIKETEILSLEYCLELSVTIDPQEQSLSSFKAGGALKCWLYCKLTFSCYIFSFDTVTGSCSTYSERQEFSYRQSKKFSYIARKQCMEDEPAAMVLEAGIANPLPGYEFLIRQIEPMMSCLTKVESEEPDLVDVGGYRVRWNTCAESNSWGLRRVEHETDKIKTQEFFQIFMIEKPDMCLDVHQPESGRTLRKQVILTKCREITQKSEEDRQIMFLLEKDFYFRSRYARGFSIYSIAETKSEHLTWMLYPGSANDKSSKALLGLTFTTSSTLRGQAGCTLSQFNITNGGVDNWNKVPFFLPGEEVTVLCEPGYGVSALNYSSLQSLVCGEGEKPLPCSLIKSEEDRGEEKSEGEDEDEENMKVNEKKGNDKEGEMEKNESEKQKEEEKGVSGFGFYLLVAFVILISAVSLFELALIVVIRRKKKNNMRASMERCVPVRDTE
ncbi:hypothetical protein ACHWQZ_G019483 [Mnemiopsis leidyi]